MMLPAKYFCLVLCLLFNAVSLKAQDSTYVQEEVDSVQMPSTEILKKDISVDTLSAAPFINIRKIPDTSLSRLKNDDQFWYADKKPERKQQKQPSPGAHSFLSSQWFSTLLWIVIIACFISALIWFLLSGNIQLFSRKSLRIQETMSDETVSENIFDIDYEKELAHAIEKQQYDLAVRLQYWRVLATLSRRELITFTPEKTNSYFVGQLYNTDYYKDFRRLTGHFEYTVYGHFPLNEGEYRVMEKEFTQFKNRIHL